MIFPKRLFVLLMLFCVPASAEPTSKIRYLMNDSLTVWDWGMYRLSQAVAGLNEPETTVRLTTTVNYNWDSNRIIIFSFPLGYQAKNVGAGKDFCESAINMIRASLGINGDNGEPYFGENSILVHYFSHTGYEKTDRPEELADELDSIIELSATIGIKGSQESIKCQGDLADKDVLFSESKSE